MAVSFNGFCGLGLECLYDSFVVCLCFGSGPVIMSSGSFLLDSFIGGKPIALRISFSVIMHVHLLNMLLQAICFVPSLAGITPDRFHFNLLSTILKIGFGHVDNKIAVIPRAEVINKAMI